MSRIEFFLTGKDLPKLDTFSQSDPFVVVSSRNDAKAQFTKFGETEIVKDRAAPVFKKRFVIDYHPDMKQELRFDVFDADNKATANAKNHDFIGQCVVGLEQLARGLPFNPQLCDQKGAKLPKGSLAIRPETVTEDDQIVKFQLSAEKLDKMDVMSQSDPFVEILRKRKTDDSWVPVYTSETVQNNANPKWKAAEVSLTELNNLDADRPILFSVWDFNESGVHVPIGQAQTTIRELQTKQVRKFALTRPAERPPKEHGNLILTVWSVEKSEKLAQQIAARKAASPSSGGGMSSTVMIAFVLLALLAAAGFFLKNKVLNKK